MKRYAILILLTSAVLMSMAHPGKETPVINVTGPSSVQVGSTQSYYYYDGTISESKLNNWSVSGPGTIVLKYISGGTYTVNVRWNAIGTGSVNFAGGSGLSVSINPAPPSTPTATFSPTIECGRTTITRINNPPVDQAWYWQTSPTGTSTALGSGASIVQTTQGTVYYLRSQLISTPGVWSSASQAVDNITVYPGPLSAPTVAHDGSAFPGGYDVVISVDPVANATEYSWYAQPTGGLSLATFWGNPSYTISNVTSSFTYYASTRYGPCESRGRLPVQVRLESPPVITASDPAIALGHAVNLFTTSAYTTYLWKDAAGTVVSTDPIFQVSTPGTYTVTVTKSGTPGSGTSAPYAVTSGAAGQTISYREHNQIRRGDVYDAATVPTLAVAANSQSIEYVDGLGMPLQNVSTQASPAGNDKVQPFVYDAAGRQSRSYLPFVSATQSGWYKPNNTIFTSAGDYTGIAGGFYTPGTNNRIADDIRPYADTYFEPTPGTRVLKQESAGADWQADGTASMQSTDRTVKKSYEVAVGTEALAFDYIYPNATYPGGTIKPAHPATYPFWQLQKNVTRDEHGSDVIDFVDKDGHTVVRKVQTAPGVYAETYYIYDDFGNLASVLPPEATRSIMEELSPGWNASGTTGVSYDANTPFSSITKTAAAGYGNAGLQSDNTLAAGASGWVEMLALETNTSRMLGLAATNVNNSINMQYAIEFRNDGKAYVWESGVVMQTLGAYQTGTVARVSREGSVVRYYIDGKLLYTSTVASTGTLLIDGALSENNATIAHVAYSFTLDANLPTLLANKAYTYAYDARRRMTQRQLPGVAPVYMVYDKRDRLVLVQDGNLRASSSWKFTKYDRLNRPILTGVKDTTAGIGLQVMQAAVDGFYGKAWTRYGETWAGSATGNILGYSNRSYPVVTTGTAASKDDYLTATYYDQYDFLSSWNNTSASYAYVNDGLAQTSNGVAYAQPATPLNEVSGKVTGTSTKVLDGGIRGSTTWLRSVTYYDDNQRVIQTVADNYKCGIDRVSTLPDFQGITLLTRETHGENDVLWRDLVGAQAIGNKLTDAAGADGWATSGAASVQSLAAGVDGWMEFTASETTSNRMIGLSTNNTDENYSSIGYAVYLYIDGSVYIFENGSNKKQVGTYAPGDIFRITRTGTAVKYFQNGVEVYPAGAAVAQTPSTTSLLVDAAMASRQGTFTNVRTSFSASARVVNHRYTYDHVGRPIDVYHSTGTGTGAGAIEVLLAHNTYNELGELVDKNLHSIGGTPYKQSVDYRYNIRGWVTSINDASLSSDGVINDDVSGSTQDYFGMNLLYNTVDGGLGNNAAYNGNISGVTWSVNQGLSLIKRNGYAFQYDPMDRITSSIYKERTATAWSLPANGGFAETGLQYDLNGNIKSLTRTDQRTGGTLDVLTYDYGTGPTASDKLLKVTDTGDKTTGFIDGANTTDDYNYDANGNLLRDLNKGVGSSLTDNVNVIAYNILNLPESVTKGGNTIRYIYDALGNKLAQQVHFNSVLKRTDYAGNFVYENDVLQFINHDEGRVAVAHQTSVYTFNGERTADATAQGAALSLTTAGTETYLVATAQGSNAGTGVFPLGESFAVQGGERYKIRAKGYRSSGSAASSHAAFVVVTIDGTSQAGAALPGVTASLTNDTWAELLITIPPGATVLEAGVTWTTVQAGEAVYLNEFEIVKLEDTGDEYQYFLRDHLGNVRLTFTTRDEVETSLATLETAQASTEQTRFQYYNEAVKVNQPLFDHTNAGPTVYATRLNGSANERYGLAKSISVMPGDIIEAEVYGKYIDPNQANLSPALINFLASIAPGGNAAAGTFIDGGAAGSIGGAAFPFAGMLSRANDTGDGPRAYLNYMFFDRNFIYKNGGFKRLSATSKENGTDVAHERIGFFDNNHIVITEPGYVYIYLSHEPQAGDMTTDVYFDDFKVTQTKSPVIQTDDYYPFGLAFNSYRRENSLPNKYLYNKGSENQDDLDLGVYQTHYRILDPSIARWWQADPKTDQQYHLSVYNAMNNNPILYNDPLGDIIDIFRRLGFLGLGKKQTLTYTNGVLTNADGTAYTGKVKGYLRRVKGALDNIRNGGASGTQLVTDLQNGARFTISRSSSDNKTKIDGTGIAWNPSDRKNDQPNGDGTTGRPAWIGLAHELGHQWDIQRNGNANTRTLWYTASNGEQVLSSDKIATWWENRVRSENHIGLRENYSFMAPEGGGRQIPDPNGGQIVNPGTRTSTVVDSTGRIYPGATLPAGVRPYTY